MKPILYALASIFLFSNYSTAQISINEIVTDPQSDWSSSKFTSIPGTGPVTFTDEYIELFISEFGVDLSNWTITIVDSDSLRCTFSEPDCFQHMAYLSDNGGQIDSTAVGDLIVLGNLVGSESMANHVEISIHNKTGELIQAIKLGELDHPSGNAQNIGNESYAAIPDGSLNYHKTIGSPARLNSLTGNVLINQIVCSPLADWSAGDFQTLILNTDGGMNDEWLELSVQSDQLNLLGWTVELIDGTDVVGDFTPAGAFSFTKYQGSGNFNDTRAGDQLLLGNVTGSGSMNNSGSIVIKDAHGNVVDSVAYGNGINPWGKGDAHYSEALIRVADSTEHPTFQRGLPHPLDPDNYVRVAQPFNHIKGWHFVATPMNGQSIINLTDDVPTSGFPGATYPEMSFTNLMFYNESNDGYFPPATVADTLSPGIGFQLYLGDVKDTIYWIGRPKADSVAFELTPGVANSDSLGWNLVGNPYLNTVNWDSPDWTKTGVENALYVWNPAQQNYATYAHGIGLNGGSPLIAAGQGFWVKTNDEFPQMTITTKATDLDDGTSFKSEVQGFKLRAQAGQFVDEAFLSTSPLPSPVPKLTGQQQLEISILAENQSWSMVDIYGLADIPLEITANTSEIELFIESESEGCQLEIYDEHMRLIQPQTEHGWKFHNNGTAVHVTLRTACDGVITSRDELPNKKQKVRRSILEMNEHYNLLGQRTTDLH